MALGRAQVRRGFQDPREIPGRPAAERLAVLVLADHDYVMLLVRSLAG